MEIPEILQEIMNDRGKLIHSNGAILRSNMPFLKIICTLFKTGGAFFIDVCSFFIRNTALRPFAGVRKYRIKGISPALRSIYL